MKQTRCNSAGLFNRLHQQVTAVHSCGGVLVVSVVWLVAAMPVGAEVVRIEARLASAVTELINGEPRSSDESTEQFPGTALELPVTTFAALGDFADMGITTLGGQSIASFNDPGLSLLANPANLGVEAECISLVGSAGFTVASEVRETRTVSFAAAELNALGTGEETLVTSRVFLEGATLAWSEDAGAVLDGLASTMRFQVFQHPADVDLSDVTNVGTVVFEVILDVVGTGAGEVEVMTQGPLEVIVGGPELVALAGGAEAQSAADALASEGLVRIVFVPRQVVRYVYPALPDEPFGLTAVVSLTATNLPDGTGVAAVFGRPFSALAETVAAGIAASGPGMPQPQVLEASINRAMRQAGGGGSNPAPRLCGTGGGAFAFLGLFGLVGLRGSRRSHS